MDCQHRKMSAIEKLARVRLDGITLDADLQPRAEIDLATVQEYAQLMADGHAFPPLVVFNDGASGWLADGFHRYHALRAIQREDCDCVVHTGTKADAVAFSLSANSGHGKQRVAADYRKAYEIGCQYRLFEAASSKSVAAALGCSLRWADKLTERAREDRDIAKQDAIARGRSEGKSIREIARETGVSVGTVYASVQKSHCAETERLDHPTRRLTDILGLPPDLPPRIVPEDPARTRQVLAQSRAKSDVLYPVGRALEAFASLPDVDAVIAADPTRRWSDINEFLPHARAWINALSEKWNV